MRIATLALIPILTALPLYSAHAEDLSDLIARQDREYREQKQDQEMDNLRREQQREAEQRNNEREDQQMREQQQQVRRAIDGSR